MLRAQWPQMGQALLETFPIARQVVDELDAALQRLADPPVWSLFGETHPTPLNLSLFECHG